MDRKKKLHYYKYIVKRHLNDIRAHIGLSKNGMERSYYRTRYAAQLSGLCRSTRHTREVFGKIYSKINDYDYKNDHGRSEYLPDGRY